MKNLVLPGAAALCLLALGCFSPVLQPPPRTSLHQQITTAAVQESVDRLDLSRLDPDTPLHVTVLAPDGADPDWIRGALESRLRRSGFRVLHEPAAGPAAVETLEMEVLVPYAGSDVENTLIGIPIFIPGLPFTFGSLSLYKSSTLTGRAALRPIVTTAEGRLVSAVPEAQAARYFQKVTFLTLIGAFTRTNLERYHEPGEEPGSEAADE